MGFGGPGRRRLIFAGSKINEDNEKIVLCNNVAFYVISLKHSALYNDDSFRVIQKSVIGERKDVHRKKHY